MNFLRITTPNSPLFDRCWEIYNYSFPRCETRDLEEQETLFQDDRYTFLAVVDGDEVMGILMVWYFESEGTTFSYVEHLAVSKESRNRGIGALCLSYLKELGCPILLEIEPPVDELTIRRQGFYERNNLVMNVFDHSHSPYRVDEGCVELKIMTWPTPFSPQSYEAFCQLQQEIMSTFE